MLLSSSRITADRKAELALEPIAVCAGNRERVSAFLRERWFSTDMVIRGETVDLSSAEGLLFQGSDGSIRALITFRTDGDTCEITSLDSLDENRGAASALMLAVGTEAVRRGASRMIVVTTNDNLRAIRFYQHRGFTVSRVYRNSLETARRVKPEIPLRGENGVPLLHEIELARML